MRCMLSNLALVCAGLFTLSGCASFPEEAEHFKFAATSPLRDFNLTQPPIPDKLLRLAQPYGHAPVESCAAWAQEISHLEDALRANAGRRVGFRRDASTLEGRAGNVRDSGVRAAVSQFVPFRGVIRQVSGAAAFEQQAEGASDRARFRIGYLVGLSRGQGCSGLEPMQSPFAPPVAQTPHWQRVPDTRTTYVSSTLRPALGMPTVVRYGSPPHVSQGRHYGTVPYGTTARPVYHPAPTVRRVPRPAARVPHGATRRP